MSDQIDVMLRRMSAAEIERMEEQVAIRREIVRRSLEEPDPAFTEELVSRCTREIGGLQDRIELLRLVVPAKPPAGATPKRRWFRRRQKERVVGSLTTLSAEQRLS